LNLAFTNAQASVWNVTGAPQTTGTTYLTVTPGGTSVQTDNAGHISGYGLLTVAYNTAQLPLSTFTVTYSGQITGTAGSNVTATIFARGPGYTVDGSGLPTTALNSISLKFVGQPAISPLNPNPFRIVGNLNGVIHGPTPLAMGGTTVLPSVQAVINGSRSNSVSLNVDVAQSQKRMVVFANGGTGTGTLGATNSYKFNVLGTGENSGYAYLLSGVLGPYTNFMVSSNVIFEAPITAQIKGKVRGQIISGSVTSGQIGAGLQ
jgi:hypothetical protein